MTPADHNLLREVSRALSENPFAGGVAIFGLPVSRDTARAMERMLLRQRVAERRAA